MEHKISAGTIARTVVLGLTLLNQGLVATGHTAIPVENEDVYTICSTVATVAASLAAWWKNNSFTAPALRADGLLRRWKQGEDEDEEK